MTPAPRLTIDRLLEEKRLERVPVDPEVCRNLVRQSENHLGTCRAGLVEDPEGAFQLAYDGCRKLASALVLALGLRPVGERHHVTTFMAAAAIAERAGRPGAFDDAADLRHARHGAEYRADTIDPDDAADAVEVLAELLERAPSLLERLLAQA